MANLAKIEGIKLAANLANTLSAGIITVGVFAPIVAILYGSTPVGNDLVILRALPFVCLGLSIILHSAGQWILKGLEKLDDDT